MLNSISRVEARRVAARILELMIAGKIGLIDGSRQLADMRHSLFGHTAKDEDFDHILAFESRTNHLPIGHERREWDLAALADKDREIGATEAAARSELLQACRGLLMRFGAA